MKTISKFIKENEYKEITWSLILELVNIYKKDLDVKCLNNSLLKTTALFEPRHNTIHINYLKIHYYLLKNISSYENQISGEDYEKSSIYFLAHCLFHEVAHAKQYFLATHNTCQIDAFVAKSYQILYSIVDGQYNEEAYIKYKKNEPFFLLDRNAELESLDVISKIAHNNNAVSLEKIFRNLYNLYYMCGYFDNNLGSIYETFSQIGIKDQYDLIYHESTLDETMRAYYGLPICEETRKKILRK